MKRVVKLLILALVLFAGYKIKSGIEISPYKEQVSSFLSLLAQHKPFKAQVLFSEELQQGVSIEDIKELASKYNMDILKEVTWNDWSVEDENYILDGNMILEDGTILPAVFTLFAVDDKVKIRKVSIGEVELNVFDKNSTSFLE